MCADCCKIKIMNIIVTCFRRTLYLSTIILISLFSGCFTKNNIRLVTQQDQFKAISEIKEPLDTARIISNLQEECARITTLKATAEVVANYRCNESVTDHEDSGDSEVFECFDSLFTIEKGVVLTKTYCIRTNNVGLYKELELTFQKNDTVFCRFKQFSLERQFNEEYLLEESLYYYHNGALISTLNRKCECMGCNISDTISTIEWHK